MASAIRAGLAYFAMVFAAGFVLGTIRVTLLAPAMGEPHAIIVELPFMIAVSWVACRYTIGRFSVPGYPAPRLLMGGLAFALLMIAEVGLGLFLLQWGVPISYDIADLVPSMPGLGGQIAFGLMPLLQMWGDDQKNA